MAGSDSVEVWVSTRGEGGVGRLVVGGCLREGGVSNVE